MALTLKARQQPTPENTAGLTRMEFLRSKATDLSNVPSGGSRRQEREEARNGLWGRASHDPLSGRMRRQEVHAQRRQGGNGGMGRGPTNRKHGAFHGQSESCGTERVGVQLMHGAPE